MPNPMFPNGGGEDPFASATVPPAAPAAPAAPSAPSALSTSPAAPSLPMIPDLGVDAPPVPVPAVFQKEQFQEIPAWTYRKFQLSDLLYSKVGISAATSLCAFSILSVLNPPFVQEKSENPIEISKPSFTVLYCISLAVFVFMMVVPVI